MAQILDICKENNIAMIASFALTPGDEALVCTSQLLGEEMEPPECFLEASWEITGMQVRTITKKE